MMSLYKTQKVFIQFTYCPLCRSNHKKGKKHVLTGRHQQIVKNVISKFSKKIAEAKSSIDEPVVKDTLWPDANCKFWCYFCQGDIERHKVNHAKMGDCVVQHGGMLEHIVRDDHVTNATAFLKANRVDLKRTVDFVLTSQLYLTFLGNAEKAISIFFRDKAQALHQVSSRIRLQAALRQQVVAAGLMDQSKHLQEKQKHQPDVVQTNSKFTLNEDGQRRKTAQAFGQGLTAVDRSNEDDSQGNIYTNAIPPWMVPDSEDSGKNTEIGPTITDLEKHRKLEKKAKLPATRVGAKFDRNADQSDTWMPSFGGVWHHSRRTDSIKKFNRRQMGKCMSLSTKPGSQSIPGQMQEVQRDHSQVEAFIYPSSTELVPHEEAPYIKILRSAATAPAPWNSCVSTSSSNSVQSGATTVSSNSQTSTLFADKDLHSNNYVYHQPHEQSAVTSASQLSVKPYVSKRKKQSSSCQVDIAAKPGYSSLISHTHCDFSYPNPSVINPTSVVTNQSRHSTTSIYHNGEPNYFSHHHNFGVNALNGFCNSSFSKHGAKPQENKGRFTTPTNTSIQQPVRLISTPLLHRGDGRR